MTPFWKSRDPKQQFDEILKKIRSKGLAAGIEDLTALAASGYPEAEFLLGDINESQFNDCRKALGLYMSAAEHGHAHGQWRTANLLLTGKGGVDRDKKQAFYWYHKAAENNIGEAQFVLGEFYRTGEADVDIPKDTNRSLEWYRKAAEHGYEPAKMRIQQFFPNGVFQEREQPAEEPPSRTQEETLQITQSLRFEIINAMQKENLMPGDEVPHIPELVPYAEKLVSFVCGAVNKDMKTRGLGDDEMVKLFSYVFLRTVDLVHQWHKTENGVIDSEITVGNPLLDDEFLPLSPEMTADLKRTHAPEIIYGIMRKWWLNNQQDLHEKGGDIWVPLSTSLLMTALAGMSVALKLFGYRK